MKIKIAKLSAILAAVALCLVMLYGAVCIPTFTLSFYRHEYNKHSIPQSIGMDTPELLNVTRHMLDYMLDKNDKLNIMTVVYGKERLFFSEREITHMVDVKNLLIAGNTIFKLALGVFVLGLVCALVLLADKRVILKIFSITPLAFVVALAVLAGLIALDFNRAFTIFHELLFTNDLWILDPSVDLLVNIVPLPFFIDISATIGAMLAAMIAFVSIGTGFAYRRLRH